MDRESKIVASIVLFVVSVFCMVMGALQLEEAVKQSFRAEAVEKGHAEYDSRTGE